ncbi:MAG: hypothetical protein AB8G23_14910 [Myxococcota bacterium]
MISSTIDAVASAILALVIVLGEPLPTPVTMSRMVLQVVPLLMPPVDPVVMMAAIPRMPMLSQILARLSEAPVALAIEAPLDAVPRAIEGMSQAPVPVGGGQDGEAIKMQIDDCALLVEPTVVSARLSNLLSLVAAIDVMSGVVAIADIMVVVMTAMSMAVSCLGTSGEDKPAGEQGADRPIHPMIVFSCHHFLFLRGLIY